MRLTLYRYSRGHGRINGFMVAVFVLIIMKIPYPSSLYFFLLWALVWICHFASHCALLSCTSSPTNLWWSLFLFVQAVNDDNSVVALHPKTMETLELFRGDTVLLKVREKLNSRPRVLGYSSQCWAIELSILVCLHWSNAFDISLAFLSWRKANRRRFNFYFSG